MAEISNNERTSSLSPLDFAKLLPKVELHAHLHGCIRPQTLEELARTRGISMSPDQLRLLGSCGERSLSDCFKIFDRIHLVVTDVSAVQRITMEALQDMDGHNVRYAELRTTPRPLPDGTTRRQYVETVLRQFREFENMQASSLADAVGNGARPFPAESRGDAASNAATKRRGLIPRLLLSVDRGRGVDEAMEVAELALCLREDDEYGRYLVGMDFGGNPRKGLFRDFRPAFAAARKGGLKITVHCGEIGNDIDTLAVIDFRPERLGHAIVLGEEVRDRLLSMEPRLPIEICPTSNRLVLALDGHGGYPMLGCWIKEGYPFSVNTDDPGVFGTDLPTEYAHLATSHGMGIVEMARLACRAVQVHVVKRVMTYSTRSCCLRLRSLSDESVMRSSLIYLLLHRSAAGTRRRSQDYSVRVRPDLNFLLYFNGILVVVVLAVKMSSHRVNGIVLVNFFF